MSFFAVHKLTIASRLVLINGLLAAAIVAVSGMAWRDLDVQTAAAGEQSRLSEAQRFHQDADTLHDGIRADVYSAFLDAELSRLTPDQIRTNLHQSTARFRADLDRLSKIALPPDIHASNEAVRALVENYISVAQETIELALRSQNEGARGLPRFDSAFEAVGAAMEAQTTALSTRVLNAERAAESAKATAQAWIVSAGLAINVLVALLVAFVSRSIRGSLKRVRDNARAMAKGNLDLRNNVISRDEVGQLAQSIDAMAGNLQSMLGQMRADSERGAFGNQLVEALEMADTETEAHQVIARAMSAVSPQNPMELLLADSSRAHLERATAHPTAGAPGCNVESPFSCVAVRRGNPVVFADSEALNACPRLRGRTCGPVSAVCVPVSFMGRALGVLHTTGDIGVPLEGDQVAKLTTLGIQAGARIGTVRAFERTQVQASTDSLTGLANRRTLEYQVRDLLTAHKPFALVMADLDRFKSLNDTLGHQAGDNALRQFADAARAAARETDLVARWGGEEFTFVLPSATAEQGLEWVDRLRTRLAEIQEAAGSTVFTASFGIADTTMGQSLENLLRIADAALYCSKDGGRDRGTIGSATLVAAGPKSHPTEHGAQVNLRLLANDHA
ncbi:MAG: diguanylate cyclase [Gammaproteobacteria bacterium]|nr:diguanylate cyclase [Gammaproteobacteria bacterium]